MSGIETSERVYVIPIARVSEAIDRLLDRDTHQYFPAYLYLRQLAGRAGRLTGLAPEWPELGAVLDMPGGPPGKPYLRPFWPGRRTSHQEWLASNLAGSYSASSLRAGRAPLQVVETDARGRFNLRDRHWELALEHLLLGERMSVIALAAFVFRDWGFVSDSEPGQRDLIDIFRREYRYGPDDDMEFDTLYDSEWRGTSDKWFEGTEG